LFPKYSALTLRAFQTRCCALLCEVSSTGRFLLLKETVLLPMQGKRKAGSPEVDVA